MADYNLDSKKLVLSKTDDGNLRDFLRNAEDVRIGALETIRQFEHKFCLYAIKDGRQWTFPLRAVDATREEAEEMRLQYLACVQEAKRIEAARREIERRLDEPKMEAKTMQQWTRDSAAIAALEALLKRSVDQYYYCRGDEIVARLRNENDNFALVAR